MKTLTNALAALLVGFVFGWVVVFVVFGVGTYLRGVFG